MESLTRSKQDWQITKSSVKERFKELLSLSQWTDCTFSVGEEDTELIRCHKLVLAVSSPVFEALFFGGLASTSEETIRVPDMEPYIFRLLLKYMYSDSLELRNVDEAGGLLYAAKKYLMPQLSQVCLDYLMDNICIKTLWDILPIAEGLAEEELLNPCLNVMCRYPYEVWWSETEGDRISSKTVMRLLEQRCMNMAEHQVWNLVLTWCQSECSARGLSQIASNMRALLNECGAMTRIRFLAMTPREFDEHVASSGLLTREECEAIEHSLESGDSGHMPDGWIQTPEARFRANQVIWRCTREVVARGTGWMYGGPIATSITSDSRVLVTGFEVFTRIADLTDFRKLVNINSNNMYRERLVLFLKDSEGNVLSKTDHDSNVEFNSVQVVNLSRPMWFTPGVRYTAVFELPIGQYPLCRFSDTARSKGATFKFDDSSDLPRLYNVGLINSVLCSL